MIRIETGPITLASLKIRIDGQAGCGIDDASLIIRSETVGIETMALPDDTVTTDRWELTLSLSTFLSKRDTYGKPNLNDHRCCNHIGDTAVLHFMYLLLKSFDRMKRLERRISCVWARDHAPFYR